MTQWKLWGLSAIQHRLSEVLDMEHDPEPGMPRPTNPDHEPGLRMCNLRVPFEGLIADATIQDIYGAEWFALSTA